MDQKAAVGEYRNDEVRLLDDYGHELGTVTLEQAHTIARELLADLVEVDPDAKPPTYIATRALERATLPENVRIQPHSQRYPSWLRTRNHPPPSAPPAR
jgi:hypothetical protein